MREIVPGVQAWRWYSQPHGYDFNGHLIRLREGNLCIDPVTPDEETLAAIEAAGVDRILLTNRNHVRATAQIRAATGARVAIHAADAAHAREAGVGLDDVLRSGEHIGPLVVVAVPGKSPGEVAFHWPERRILVAGDCVIGHPPGELGLLKPAVTDDPALLRQSVRRLAELDFDTVLVGDGVSILNGARAALLRLLGGLDRDGG